METQKMIPNDNDVLNAVEVLMSVCHGNAWNAGWWHDPITGKEKERNFGELIALMHSELSEALEGNRKDSYDEHIINRKSEVVELIDCLIRIFDLLGKKYSDEAMYVMVEKLTYNKYRADHKPENRAKDGGKKF